MYLFWNNIPVRIYSYLYIYLKKQQHCFSLFNEELQSYHISVCDDFEMTLERKTLLASVAGSDVYNCLGTMAPLDLDKYAEIAKQCKYLPENDLKVNVTFLTCFC